MSEQVQSAKVQMCIRRPIQEVFEAFVDPDITTKFWFTKSSGKLEAGQALVWAWEMYNVEVPVHVKTIKANESILIEWGTGRQQSMVQWDFKSLSPNDTYLTITNYDFKGSAQEVIPQVIDSTEGFSLVIAGLKAWLEHQVQLNLVGDKFPKELMNQ